MYHVSDDPVFVEQRTSVISDIEYENTITLTKEQFDELREFERYRVDKIHSFRATDDYDIYDAVRGVVPLD